MSNVTENHEYLHGQINANLTSICKKLDAIDKKLNYISNANDKKVDRKELIGCVSVICCIFGVLLMLL